MSTMDPIASQRAKRRRRAGDRRFLAAAIAGTAAMVAGAFMFGLAVATTAEMLRHFSIGSYFDERVPYPTFWGVGTIGYLWTVGFSGLVLGSSVATHLFDAYRGGEKQPRMLAPLAVCAVALAVVVDSPTWLGPLDVGVNRDPVFHEDTTWSALEWIAYYADRWFPAVVVVIAGLVVVLSVRHNRRLRLQLAERDRLLAEGRRARGVVTGVTVRTTVNDQGQRSVVGADVTVRFADDHGVQRWVTRFSKDRSAMPGTGFVEVLFDPLRPGDQDRIFVSLYPGPAPAEWIGPTL